MAAGGVGYWATGYWNINYWNVDYWAEVGSGPVISTMAKNMVHAVRIDPFKKEHTTN